MHSTHHNQLKFSSYVYVQKKKKKERVTIYNRGETNELERLQKVTWWLLPIFTHTHTHSHLDYTGLGSINTYSTVLHRFKLYKEF